MAKRELREGVLQLRREGKSYSQIREALEVSKGSLSLWLRDYPLSRERINELRGNSERRIERCRETKSLKRIERMERVKERATIDIGTLSEREKFLCGLFLYWGEGGKTKPTSISISNTDPSVLIYFIQWTALLGVPKDRLRVHLHLYVDMNVEEEIAYWSRTLDLPVSAFRKPYIKTSKRSGLTYKQRFIHGTCNVIYENRDIGEYVHAAIESLRKPLVAVDP